MVHDKLNKQQPMIPTDKEIEIINLIQNPPSGAGMIVETKSGLIGKVISSESKINGKVRVYTEKGNLLCDPDNLILKGFID